MNPGHGAVLAFVFLTLSCLVDGNNSTTDMIRGKRWAVLVAGSRGYENYRHQADVCHAYQILKKGGLSDENIVVFMYDDIAFHSNNPRPGVIINKPNGDDVYEGVPKDYTGLDVTAHNFYAVILGNKSAVSGGSGKVVDSGPKDSIFIYFSDHGAANAVENSWGTYCPGEYPSPPEEYDTCLGDLYSISWMEDCDKHDLRKETLGQQYKVVRRRTAAENVGFSSHVMQYGSAGLSHDPLFSYIGTNPANDNYTFAEYASSPLTLGVVSQRDADLLHFWYRYHKAPVGSQHKLQAQKQLFDEISYRKHVDYSISQIGKLLFADSDSSMVLESVRPIGQPLVDDWDCLKMIVRTYEKSCGSLSNYGMKYTRVFANMCNFGVTLEQVLWASIQACSVPPPP
ncbi:hypothetical protein I3760_02G127900 [Carya illinoinensis]|nr:hypothetical protein I3760_02G127900 [Carya illinoinensis]